MKCEGINVRATTHNLTKNLENTHTHYVNYEFEETKNKFINRLILQMTLNIVSFNLSIEI